MDAANAIAMVGILTTGAVGITAQVVSHRREAATRLYSERLQRDSEARAVLDQALATAYEAIAALDDYANALGRLSADRRGSSAPVDTVRAVANAVGAKFQLGASRLIVRFGPEDIVYASYASALLAYFDLLRQNEGFLAHLKLGEAERDPEIGTTADTRHLDRLVFGFAAHAHEWATDARA